MDMCVYVHVSVKGKICNLSIGYTNEHSCICTCICKMENICQQNMYLNICIYMYVHKLKVIVYVCMYVQKTKKEII